MEIRFVFLLLSKTHPRLVAPTSWHRSKEAPSTAGTFWLLVSLLVIAKSRPTLGNNKERYLAFEEVWRRVRDAAKCDYLLLRIQAMVHELFLEECVKLLAIIYRVVVSSVGSGKPKDRNQAIVNSLLTFLHLVEISGFGRAFQDSASSLSVGDLVLRISRFEMRVPPCEYRTGLETPLFVVLRCPYSSVLCTVSNKV